jgi:hypothetical protein
MGPDRAGFVATTEARRLPGRLPLRTPIRVPLLRFARRIVRVRQGYGLARLRVSHLRSYRSAVPETARVVKSGGRTASAILNSTLASAPAETWARAPLTFTQRAAETCAGSGCRRRHFSTRERRWWTIRSIRPRQRTRGGCRESFSGGFERKRSGIKKAAARDAVATPKPIDICCMVLAMELALLVCSSVTSA